MTKSWAEALGVVIPKDEAPAPPAPAWGGASVTAAPAQLARDSRNPLPFEFALQEALRVLVVTAPGKEMKKRCVIMLVLIRIVILTWMLVVANLMRLSYLVDW